MAIPYVVAVPPTGAPVQIPLSGGTSCTLTNLSGIYPITLCSNDGFVNGTTWPLSPGICSVFHGSNTLFAKNSGPKEIDILVQDTSSPSTNVSNISQYYYNHLINESLAYPPNLNGQQVTLQPTSTALVFVSSIILLMSGNIIWSNGLITTFTNQIIQSPYLVVPIPPGSTSAQLFLAFADTSLPTNPVVIWIDETNSPAYVSNVGLSSFPSAGSLPLKAIPVSAQSGIINGATATCQLAAVVGATNYVTGVQFGGTGATAASVATLTVTGLATGDLHLPIPIPTGNTNPVGPVIIPFPTPVPASAVDTAIVATFSSGGSLAGGFYSANIQGYYIKQSV